MFLGVQSDGVFNKHTYIQHAEAIPIYRGEGGWKLKKEMVLVPIGYQLLEM